MIEMATKSKMFVILGFFLDFFFNYSVETSYFVHTSASGTKAWSSLPAPVPFTTLTVYSSTRGGT